MLIIIIFLTSILLIISLKLSWELRHARREAKELQRMKSLVENVKDIIYSCEVPSLSYHYLSPEVEKVFGPHALEEHLANPTIIFELIHPDDRELLAKKRDGLLDYNEPIPIRLKNYRGEYVWYEDYATPIYENGQLVAIQGIYRNIHERVQLSEQLKYKASHDALTALHNRSYFDLKVQQYNEQNNLPIAFVICDLDNLKYVNDCYGHAVGDDLIKAAATICKKIVHDDEFVARIGGDEFAFLLPNATETRIQELFAQLQAEIDLANERNETFKIEMSKGYAYHTSSINQMERLYMEADDQMYQEKQTKQRYRMSGEKAVNS